LNAKKTASLIAVSSRRETKRRQVPYSKTNRFLFSDPADADARPHGFLKKRAASGGFGYNSDKCYEIEWKSAAPRLIRQAGKVMEQQRQIDNYKIVLLVAGLIGIVALANALRDVYASLTIALVSFYILDPIATWFTDRKIGRFKIPHLTAVAIAFIVGALVVTVFLLILIPPIVEQIKRFTENLPSYIRNFEDMVKVMQQKYRTLELPPEVDAAIQRSAEKISGEFITVLHNAAKNTSNFFSQIMLLFMTPFLTFYLLLEKKSVGDAIVHVLPRKNQDEFGVMLRESSAALRGYIVGQLLLSLIMGVIITIILGLMHVKAPLLLGLIAGVTKMIPVIGIFIGCIPAALVALSDSTTLALWVVIIFTTIQLLENKVILPVLLSRYVNLSPLTILLALIVGEQLGGILGMFVAPPVTAVLHVIYIHVRKKYD
jgi:predicted PurR-regulated permease PerM